MTLLKKMGLNVGLESENKQSQVAIVGSPVGLSAAVAIAESTAELAEVNVQVDGLVALERIQNRLVNIESRIRNIAVDGLTKREAQLVQDNVDDINEELGAELIAMPALESFGDKISAKSHTEVGLEAVNDSAKKVWEFILDTVNKIKDMFMKWWDKFFGSVERLKKYADSVKAKAEKYNTDKDNKKVEVKGAQLYTAGAKPDAGKVKAGVTAIAQSVEDFMGKHSEVAEAACDALTTAMENTEASKLKATAKTFTTNANVVKFTSGAHIAATITDGYLYGKDIMGGKGIELVNPHTMVEVDSAETSARKEAYAAVGKVSYKVKGSDAKVGDKTIEIDRLSKSDVETVAEGVSDMAEALLNLRKSRTDARKYADDVVKAAKSTQKEAEGLDDADKANKAELVAMGKAATSVLKEVIGGTMASWSGHIVNVGFAAVKLADKSI